MKSSKKRELPLLKGDIILVISICLLVAFLFMTSFMGKNEKLTAEIYHKGELVRKISFSDTEREEITVGSCVLLLENDGVTFISSKCPDKLCVKKGKLKRKGDTMACVPEKVVAVIKGEKTDDFHIATY